MPVVAMTPEGMQATYFNHASDAQLEWISPVQEWAVEGGRRPDPDHGRDQHPRALERPAGAADTPAEGDEPADGGDDERGRQAASTAGR